MCNIETSCGLMELTKERVKLYVAEATAVSLSFKGAMMAGSNVESVKPVSKLPMSSKNAHSTLGVLRFNNVKRPNVTAMTPNATAWNGL